MSKKIRVVFYGRVSKQFQVENGSLDRQLQGYKERIDNNKEWEFVGEYCDGGKSGTGTKKRPEFNQMIKDAKEGKFDLIITKEISRFSRKAQDKEAMDKLIIFISTYSYFHY